MELETIPSSESERVALIKNDKSEDGADESGSEEVVYSIGEDGGSDESTSNSNRNGKKGNPGIRMKPAEFKRVLLLFTVGCVLFFIYLYWQQSTPDISALPKYVYTYRPPPQPYTKQKHDRHGSPVTSQWTWQCVNQRCERRRHPDPSTTPIAFSTCSMLCNSTQLWPQPTGPVTLGSRAATFNHLQLELDTADVAEPALALLQQSFLFFNANIVSLVDDKAYLDRATDVHKFTIRVDIEQSDVVRLKLTSDESYHLLVKTKDDAIAVKISAKTFFGARHGLETLSQLIWWDEFDNGGALKILRGASVHDAPSFAYRGLMLDTARNFMSIDGIKRVIVGMAANKLNVFHWHITDSQSFPFVSPRVPQLAKYGAYSADEVYQPEQVAEVVAFARVHGVRVLIEVDTPAHAGNGWTWGAEEGLGELAVCVNERPWSLYCGEPPCGQLNPSNPHVYDVLEKLYKDVLELTGETELFHLGGDEVNLDCWAQQRTINVTDLHTLWGEFTTKALERLRKANNGAQVPAVVVWSSNLSKRPYVSLYMDKAHVVVQSWGASRWPDTPDLLADGYRVIISHVDAWYLDCGFGRWRETGDAACDPYRPWQTLYTHRPWQLFRWNKKQIMGGEACLWTEQVDEFSLDTRLWPRTAAFAERMWTDPQIDESLSVAEDVYTRLSTQRERLVGRGLGAEPLWPGWCAQNPGMCL